MKKKIFVSICCFLFSACQFKNNKYIKCTYHKDPSHSNFIKKAEHEFSLKLFLEAVFDRDKDINLSFVEAYKCLYAKLDKIVIVLKQLNKDFQYYYIIENYIDKYKKMLKYGYGYYFIPCLFFSYHLYVPKFELDFFCEQYKKTIYLVSGYLKNQFNVVTPKDLQNLIQKFYNLDFIFPKSHYRSFFTKYDSVFTIHVDRASYGYAKQCSLELYLNNNDKFSCGYYNKLPYKYYGIDNYKIPRIKTEKKLKLHNNEDNKLVFPSLPIQNNLNLSTNNTKPEEGYKLIIHGFDLSALTNPNSVTINIIKLELNNIEKINKEYDVCEFYYIIRAITGIHAIPMWDMLYKNRKKLRLNLIDALQEMIDDKRKADLSR